MSKYDSDKIGVIKYSDFCSAIFPNTNEYASLLQGRIPSYQHNTRIENVIA